MPSLESSCFSESKAQFSLTDVFLEHQSMSELAAVSHIYENIMLHFLWWGPHGFHNQMDFHIVYVKGGRLQGVTWHQHCDSSLFESLFSDSSNKTQTSLWTCFCFYERSLRNLSWCLSSQLPGWILEGFFYLNKQTALNEDYQDYYYHDHVVVIALSLQRKHTRRRWVCHPLTSVTICRYRKYLIFLVKKSPFSAKAEPLAVTFPWGV